MTSIENNTEDSDEPILFDAEIARVRELPPAAQEKWVLGLGLSNAALRGLGRHRVASFARVVGRVEAQEYMEQERARQEAEDELTIQIRGDEDQLRDLLTPLQ